MKQSRRMPAEASYPDDAVQLATLPCRTCGCLGITIVALSGEAVLAWCGPAHARIEGWPFLTSEPSHPARSRRTRADRRPPQLAQGIDNGPA